MEAFVQDKDGNPWPELTDNWGTPRNPKVWAYNPVWDDWRYNSVCKVTPVILHGVVSPEKPETRNPLP